MAGNAGIAIGPILFIVAILAILVGALAAGDSGFSTSITTESARVNATTIIEQGNNLQSAMDRVLADGATSPATDVYVVANVATGNLTAQEQTAALFAPSGGGLTYPTPPASAVPVAAPNAWDFVPSATLLGIGTGVGEYIAVLPIATQAMCLALNSVIFGQNSAQATAATIPTTSDTVTVVAPSAGTGTLGTSNTTSVAPTTNAFGTTGATGVSGSAQGCVQDAGGAWYYYQLLLAN